MQNKIDFNYLYQGFMPANINLYQTGNFESSHLGDNAATLEMLCHYSENGQIEITVREVQR